MLRDAEHTQKLEDLKRMVREHMAAARWLEANAALDKVLKAAPDNPDLLNKFCWASVTSTGTAGLQGRQTVAGPTTSSQMPYIGTFLASLDHSG